MSKRAKEAALKSYPPKRKSEFLTKFAEMTGSIDTMPKNTLPPSEECEKGLQEPLVNDGLEEAAKEFAKDAYPDKHNLVWMFKRGAKWQKEQDDKELSEKIASAYQLGLADKEKKMMEEAVEGEVVQDLKGVNRVKSFSKIPEWLYFGDKVKLIIVKED